MKPILVWQVIILQAVQYVCCSVTTVEIEMKKISQWLCHRCSGAQHQLTPQLQTSGLVDKPLNAFLMGQKSQSKLSVSQGEIIVVSLLEADDDCKQICSCLEKQNHILWFYENSYICFLLMISSCFLKSHLAGHKLTNWSRNWIP